MIALLRVGVGGDIYPGGYQLSERVIFGKRLLVEPVKGNQERPRPTAVKGSQQGQLSDLLRSKAKGNGSQFIGWFALSHDAMITEYAIHCQYQYIDNSIHMCYTVCMTAKDGKPCKKCGASWWYENNGGLCVPCNRLKNHLWRTRNNTGGSYTIAEWAALLVLYGNKCLCCGRDDARLYADHVIPVVKGGSSNIDNIQPLCASCNSRKGSKIIDYRPRQA